ncbi:MAG: class I SAM-dependent methyltransferase [Acidobacteriota bacterium]|nr:class I SAM-dependent methyltransferase [Acidobacteriota bacterium]
MTGLTTPVVSTVSERRLARALARRCRGTTLLLGPRFGELIDACRDRDVTVITRPARAVAAAYLAGDVDSAGDVDTFETVILWNALDGGSAPVEACAEGGSASDGVGPVLHGAWRRCAPDGRLIVCVPNGECLSDPGSSGPVTRRELKTLLRELAEPKVIKDQPYQWIVMQLDVAPVIERTVRQRFETIARLCSGRVLELGCGPGHLSQMIGLRGLDVRGVDKSRVKIVRARQLYPKIPFEEADILDLPRDAGYDTVVLSEVLEHVPEETGSEMLDAAWEKVAPGGRLVVSVPNENCVPHPNHVREFTRLALDAQLRAYGETVLVADQPYKWLLMFVEKG